MISAVKSRVRVVAQSVDLIVGASLDYYKAPGTTTTMLLIVVKLFGSGQFMEVLLDPQPVFAKKSSSVSAAILEAAITEIGIPFDKIVALTSDSGIPLKLFLPIFTNMCLYDS